MIKRSFLMIAMIFLLMQSVYSQALMAQKAESNDSYSTTYYFTVNFSADSLGTHWTKLMTVSNYWGTVGSVNLYTTGTTPKYTCQVYFTDFKDWQDGSIGADTNWGRVAQNVDTTGIYLGKVVSDSLSCLDAVTGFPHKYAYLRIKGLANNRENVVINGAVTFYLKQE